MNKYENMTIKSLQNERDNCNKKLEIAITEFEKNTGMHVKAIAYEFSNMYEKSCCKIEIHKVI